MRRIGAVDIAVYASRAYTDAQLKEIARLPGVTHANVLAFA
jgi:hypothetical protein